MLEDSADTEIQLLKLKQAEQRLKKNFKIPDDTAKMAVVPKCVALKKIIGKLAEQ